ncbi:MAG: hypothetical protein H0T75_14675 [Rhizobiales bacterium]|nr:hypothetical protein [Hyphomicrobiales bacterium]
MTQSVSPALVADGGSTSCRRCGHRFGSSGESWKAAARVREVPLHRVGKAFDTGTGDGAVRLRHFYCPNCATLLDTETALEGNPFLDDRVGV